MDRALTSPDITVLGRTQVPFIKKVPFFLRILFLHLLLLPLGAEVSTMGLDFISINISFINKTNIN